jgi:hypothetical protein
MVCIALAIRFRRWRSSPMTPNHDDRCANTHVLNEVKDQRRANPHRDSLATKACPERSEG